MMKLPRRRFLHLAAAAAVLPAVTRIAAAETYPNRYVRLVVPFPPGGGGDALARPLANRLSEAWGQQVVIENKGGAGGNIGAQAVAQSAPDIPTIGESVPGYEVSTWWALFAPAKTPAEIVTKINADALAALAHPSVKQRYEAIGAPVTGSTPAELAVLLASDMQKWGPIVKEAGIKAE